MVCGLFTSFKHHVKLFPSVNYVQNKTRNAQMKFVCMREGGGNIEELLMPFIS